MATVHMAIAHTAAGYPIAAGGRAIVSNTSSLQLQCFLCLDGMGGGFSIAGVTLPLASVAIPISKGISFGTVGEGGQIISATGANGGRVEFGNNATFFTFAGMPGSAAVFVAKGTTDGQLGIYGTSTGYTSINTANTGATNFTITLPSATGTAMVYTGTVAPGSGGCPSGTVGGQTVAGCATASIGGVVRNVPFY
jgi:hypothetical protein